MNKILFTTRHERQLAPCEIPHPLGQKIVRRIKHHQYVEAASFWKGKDGHVYARGKIYKSTDLKENIPVMIHRTKKEKLTLLYDERYVCTAHLDHINHSHYEKFEDYKDTITVLIRNIM